MSFSISCGVHVVDEATAKATAAAATRRRRILHLFQKAATMH